jgi:hypothetical protein
MLSLTNHENGRKKKLALTPTLNCDDPTQTLHMLVPFAQILTQIIHMPFYPVLVSQLPCF